MKKAWENLKGKTYKLFEFILKSIMLIILFLSAYTLIGFPIEKDVFLDILPSLITVLSVLLVFYNVNRTQQKNFLNDIKKFRRDTRIKVADDLIDCFAGIDDLIRSIKVEVRKNDFTIEKRNEIVEAYRGHSKKINAILYKRKEVIEYCEDVKDRNKGMRLSHKIWVTLTSIETKLIRLDRDNWASSLDELQEKIHTDILKHREDIVELLYGDIFKQKSFNESGFWGKLTYGNEGSNFLPIVLIIGIILYVATFFKSYLLTLFIK